MKNNQQKSSKKYDKLVRDKIPRILKNQGIEFSCHVASEKEFETKLKKKLFEEIEEFFEDPSSEELADIFEVLRSLAKFYGVDIFKTYEARTLKFQERGGFDEQVILEEVLESVE